MKPNRRYAAGQGEQDAFSLVEVVLALGVVSFALLSIVALLPVGMKSSHDSLEKTRAIYVLSQLIADRKATPIGQPSTLYQLSALTAIAPGATVTNLFGVDQNNQSTGANFSQAQYRVNAVITAPATGRLDPYQSHITISWPAPSANPAGAVEAYVTFPQP